MLFLKLADRKGRVWGESFPSNKTLSPELQRTSSLSCCFLPSSPASAGAETKSWLQTGPTRQLTPRKGAERGLHLSACLDQAQISVIEAAKVVLHDLGMVDVIQAGLCLPGRREGLYHLHFGQKTSLLKSAPEASRCCLVALSHLALKAVRCWSSPQVRKTPCSPLRHGGEGLRTSPPPTGPGPPRPPQSPAISPACSAQGRCRNPMLPKAPWQQSWLRRCPLAFQSLPPPWTLSLLLSKAGDCPGHGSGCAAPPHTHTPPAPPALPPWPQSQSRACVGL